MEEIVSNDDELAVKRHRIEKTEKEEEKKKKLISESIYIGNIDPRISKLHLEKLMSSYGTIVDVIVCYNNDNFGKKHAFGFCKYSNSNEAAIAIRSLHGRKLFGKALKVKYKHLSSSTQNYKEKIKKTSREQLNLKITTLRRFIAKAAPIVEK